MKRNEMKGKILNSMYLVLPSYSVNEGIARGVVAAFCAQLNPTASELGDIKCALSEAVTNSIVHGYKGLAEGEIGYVYISVKLYSSREITVEISDDGCGIEDVARAREPMFTTGEYGDRCGMGFLVMESFTDYLSVDSQLGLGTTVMMRKKLRP